MMGSNIFDYIHRQDHAELAECLGLSAPLTPMSRMKVTPSPLDDSSSIVISKYSNESFTYQKNA